MTTRRGNDLAHRLRAEDVNVRHSGHKLSARKDSR